MKKILLNTIVNTFVKVSPYKAFLREIRAIYFIISFLVLCLLILAGLVHVVGVFPIDIAFTHLAQYLHQVPGVDAPMQVFTFLGNAGVSIGAALLAAIYFWQIKLNKSAFFILLSLLALPINVIIKDLVARTRPTSLLVEVLSPAGGYSFPSGHAMISMSVYGAIAYFLWIRIQSPRQWLIPVVAGLVIFLIGFSRVYLGVHWASDVIGGWIGGLVLLLLLAEVYKFKKLTAITKWG